MVLLIMVSLNLFFVSVFMTFLFLVLNFMNEEKFFKLNSSMFSVECGFQELSVFPSSSSNQFFMISVIFVIFDMELLVLMPLPFSIFMLDVKLIVMSIMILMFIGLLMEWKSNLLKWAKSQFKLY